MSIRATPGLVRLGRGVLPWLPSVQLGRVEVADILLGHAVRLHDKADHRVVQHLLEEEIHQALAGEIALGNRVRQFCERHSERSAEPGM